MLSTVRNRIRNSPTTKYGSALVTTKTEGSTESTMPPRRHAAIVPISEPSRNASTVVKPTRPSVQGSAWPISLDTGVPSELPRDTPQLPVIMLPK